jgi:catechol 2,3-dioxygenase-like lactoylglutathione lyase family enzyme
MILANRKNGRVALQRMDNVGIVVESLDAAISFFAELGLELEGRAMIEGDWSGRVTGLRDQRVEIAMMRAPDGHGRIELSRFLAPPVVADHRNAPVNALGYLRVMFAVDDLDDTLARLRRHGAQLVDEVVQYEVRVSALLRPRPRGHSHRACRANRLTPDTRSGVIPQHWRRRRASPTADLVDALARRARDTALAIDNSCWPSRVSR